MESPIEDLKNLKNYVLGIAGFSTSVSAVLIQIFHFPTEITVAMMILISCLFIVIVYLIGRAEGRQKRMLEAHVKASTKTIRGFDKRLDMIDSVLADIQKSTLRTEICNEIERYPENHDTIIRMGERYFCELGGNWVMFDLYQRWIDSENAEGRPVYLPPQLLAKMDAEKK